MKVKFQFNYLNSISHATLHNFVEILKQHLAIVIVCK